MTDEELLAIAESALQQTQSSQANLAAVLASTAALAAKPEPEPMPHTPTEIDVAWQAALTNAQGAAARFPLAWGHVRASLGAAFPAGIRSTALTQADKDAGANVLSVLCSAAAQLEPQLKLNGTKALTESRWLRSHFAQRHPPKPVPQAYRHSAALTAARRLSAIGGPRAVLERAIDVARELFSAAA